MISCTLKRLEILRQVESGDTFAAERNLRMGIAVRRGDFRGAPNREYREKSNLLDAFHANPQVQVHLQGDGADYDGSAASTSEAHRRQYYARQGRILRRMESPTCHFTCGKLLASRGGGQLADSVVGGRDGGSTARKGLVKGPLLQTVSVTTQVAISRKVSRFKLLLKDRQESKRNREERDDRPTPMARGWIF